MRLFAAPWRRNPADEGTDAGLDGLARRLQEISEGHDAPAEHVATARSRMRLAVARERNRQPALGLGWRRLARRPLVAAAVVAAVLIAGGAISMLAGGAGGPAGLIGSQTAEAVVLTGILEAQGGGFTLVTDTGPQPIFLGAQAVIVDAVGNPVPIDSLTRGQQLSVKAKRDDNDHLVVDEIQAKSEVRGRITSLTAGQIQVTGERTSITVLITDTTQVKGNLAVGQLVEVEVARNAAGDLVAREIEADDDGHDKEESGLPAAPTAPAAPALYPTQAKRDDGGREGASPQPTSAPPTPAPVNTAGAAAPTRTPDRERETESDGYQPASQPTSAPVTQTTSTSGSGGTSGSGSHDSHDEHDSEHDH